MIRKHIYEEAFGPKAGLCLDSYFFVLATRVELFLNVHYFYQSCDHVNAHYRVVLHRNESKVLIVEMRKIEPARKLPSTLIEF